MENSAALPDSSQLQTILSSLDNAKAMEIVSIDIRENSPLADFMVIASGRSPRHIGAVADHLMRSLKESGCNRIRVEGLGGHDWILIDTGDIIVHIFRPEVREFYNLEKIWVKPALDGEDHKNSRDG